MVIGLTVSLFQALTQIQEATLSFVPKVLVVFGTLLLPLTVAILGLTALEPWVSTVLMGISWSLVPAVIWPATTMVVPRRQLGTALGLITLIQALGIGAANLGAGIIADRAGAGPANPAGYDAVLLFFGAVSLAALASVVMLWRYETGPNGHGLERPTTPRKQTVRFAD